MNKYHQHFSNHRVTHNQHQNAYAKIVPCLVACVTLATPLVVFGESIANGNASGVKATEQSSIYLIAGEELNSIQPVLAPQPQVIIKEVPVPGPVRTVIKEVPVPGPVRTVIKEVPVPGPVRTVIKKVEVPGPERIVVKEVIKEVTVPGPVRTIIKEVPVNTVQSEHLPSSGIGLNVLVIAALTGTFFFRRWVKLLPSS